MSEPVDEPQSAANKRKGHFFRAVGYLRPYRKWVAISIICALMTGAFTASGLGAMLPLLNVLVQGTSVPTYLDSIVVERQMQLTLNSEAGGFRVVRYKDSAPDQPYPAGTVLSRDDVARLSAERIDDAPFWLRTLRQIGGWLPLHPVGAIASIFAVFFGIALLGSVTRFFQEYLSDTCAVASINDIRRQLYDHVLHLPVGYFAKHGTGDVTARLVTDAQGLQDGFKTVLGKAIQEPINAVFALTLAMLIDWRLTLFVIVFAPAMVAVVKHFGTRVRRAARAALQKNALMFGQIESTLSGIRVVKSAAAEPHERRKYRNILENLKREQFRMSRYEAWSTPALELLGLIAVGGVLIVASYFVLVQHSLQAPQFMVIMFALVVIGESLRRVSKLNNVLQRSNAAAARIFEVLDRASESQRFEQHREPSSLAGAVPAHQLAFRTALQFDDVTFRYPGAPSASLENVKLEIPKGTSVAVVGRNGSGKTTLLSLLPRFYDPESGAVRLDGVDVRDWPIRRLRRMIGIVTQEAIIFPGTIHENIAYANPTATREQVIDAAKRAYAHDFIMDKPDGYDTSLDGLGSQLSGGQRQRINIARAILRDTPILILDEATSQVDAESEHLIQQAITALMKSRTTFVIAHRFSTILSADMIVVLERGRIVGTGKHDDLLRDCDTYRQLYERQLFAA